MQTTYQDLGTLLRRHFADVVSVALQSEYEATGLSPSLPDAQTCVLIQFPVKTDGMESLFIICFPETSLPEVRSQFLRTNIGEALAQGAQNTEIFSEIANIIVGHIAGLLSDHGGKVEILDPGLPILDWPAGVGHLTAGAANSAEGMVFCAMKSDGTDLPPPPDPGPAPQPAPAAPEPEPNRPRVLIVDDSSVMRAFLQQIFTEAGYDVVGVAADGVDAIEKFEATRPDLMTLDIIMPKMKGTEVLEKLLAKYPDAKVVMASSVNDARTVMKCLKIGAKRYIIKPYDKDAVIAAAQKALGVVGEE